MTAVEIVLKVISINVGSKIRMTTMQYKLPYRTHKVTLFMISIAMLTLSLNNTVALASGQSATVASKELKSSLPPIDTAAPSRFETASFGLG